MHTLTYKINPTNDGSNVFRAVFDGKETEFSMDVAAIDISRQVGGVCPILFCEGCGQTGCAGYYAFVEVLGEEIIWSHFYECFYDPEKPEEYKTLSAKFHNNGFELHSEEFEVSAPIRFKKSEYVALADKLISELKNYPREKEVYESNIEHYKSGDRFRG